MVDGDHSVSTQSSPSRWANSGVMTISADNGIYVLHTKGPEFRVAYAQGIDSVYGKINDETDKWEGNGEMMRLYFGNSVVHTDIDEAMNEAEDLSTRYDYLEDGVCLIPNFANKNFSDF